MKKIIYLLLLMMLFSCESGIKKGRELSIDEITFIKRLGLLEESEKIILFDSQADSKTSGNFISDKRLASYWIDKRDKRKTEINYAYYQNIDTITFKDLSKSLTYASFLEAVKKDGKKLKVYMEGDSSEVRNFYKVATTEWKNSRSFK